MPGRIYRLEANSQLLPLTETPYDSEALLQRLLSEHPDLLAGDQMNSASPRRWLLVTAEMSVPGEVDGSRRWSLDHLFLDQDAIPTLVEVKRSTDTRIRRKVVGQLLDYAANAVVHWPIEEIKAKFQDRCADNDINPDEALKQLVGEDQAVADYWQEVQSNLEEGRVRLVFLSDAIPSELRRIVEFLNEQMDRTEVLAVEVKQFIRDGMTILVPRVIGQSQKALQKKSSPGTPRTNIPEDEFLAHVEAKRPADEHPVFQRLIAWAREEGLEASFTSGPKGFQFFPILRLGKQEVRPMNLNAKGWVRFYMRHVKTYPPFDDSAKRDDLYERIKDLPDLQITDAGMEGSPKVLTAGLADEAQLSRLLAAFSWLVAELRRAD